MTENFFNNEVNISGVGYLFQLLLSFEEGRLPLHILSQRLDAARHGLIQPEAQWLATYEKYWGAIEECNALALDEGTYVVRPEDGEFLRGVVSEFKKFLSETFPVYSQPPL